MREGEGICQNIYTQHVYTDNGVVTARRKGGGWKWRWARGDKWGQKET